MAHLNYIRLRAAGGSDGRFSQIVPYAGDATSTVGGVEAVTEASSVQILDNLGGSDFPRLGTTLAGGRERISRGAVDVTLLLGTQSRSYTGIAHGIGQIPTVVVASTNENKMAVAAPTSADSTYFDFEVFYTMGINVGADVSFTVYWVAFGAF